MASRNNIPLADRMLKKISGKIIKAQQLYFQTHYKYLREDFGLLKSLEKLEHQLNNLYEEFKTLQDSFYPDGIQEIKFKIIIGNDK